MDKSYALGLPSVQESRCGEHDEIKWIATPEQQVSKLGFAVAVEAHDFAVENRRPGTQPSALVPRN
jgi:hypothetical protein